MKKHMAFPCVKNGSKECDGCGACQQGELFGYCESCSEPIYIGEDIYELDGITLHDDCLYEYMRAFRTVAER